MDRKEQTFEYTYSAPQQAEIRKIREKYQSREEDKLEQLRRLDRSAGAKGRKPALTLGILSALLLGVGMCCTMVWREQWFIPGVVIGLVGLAGAALAYPLYARIAKRQREKIAPEVLRLADELMD